MSLLKSLHRMAKADVPVTFTCSNCVFWQITQSDQPSPCHAVAQHERHAGDYSCSTWRPRSSPVSPRRFSTEDS